MSDNYFRLERVRHVPLRIASLALLAAFRFCWAARVSLTAACAARLTLGRESKENLSRLLKGVTAVGQLFGS